MTKQIFKLVWNRKRFNVLIIAEIFFSFVALFAAVTACVYYADNYRQPLGFEWKQVWTIDIKSSGEGPGHTDQQEDAQEVARTAQLLRTLRDQPEIEAVGALMMTPFSVGMFSDNVTYKGREFELVFNDAGDGIKDALGLRLVSGRWFDSSDDADNFEPVVINQKLARELFGTDDPVGKVLLDQAEYKRQRVIGVITDFRQHGEFHGLNNYAFYRQRTDKTPLGKLGNLLVKVRPGTPAAFEEKLMGLLQSAAPAKTFRIEPLSKARRSHMKLALAPVAALALIVGFLILMVGLGMVGVVCQSVARRTREIGLRRAVGSPANAIHIQVLGELLVVSSVGLALGAALVLQLPLLDLVSFLSARVYATSLCLSAMIIYGLTLLSGLYPSLLATRVQPSDVLRYE